MRPFSKASPFSEADCASPKLGSRAVRVSPRGRRYRLGTHPAYGAGLTLNMGAARGEYQCYLNIGAMHLMHSLTTIKACKLSKLFTRRIVVFPVYTNSSKNDRILVILGSWLLFSKFRLFHKECRNSWMIQRKISIFLDFFRKSRFSSMDFWNIDILRKRIWRANFGHLSARKATWKEYSGNLISGIPVLPLYTRILEIQGSVSAE